MVNYLEFEEIQQLVNDCITTTSYDATKAFADLNRYISKLRKKYQESKE